MSDSPESTNKDLQSALAFVRAMTPRSPEEREQCSELGRRILLLGMEMRGAASDTFEASQRDKEAFDLKDEAIRLARELHRPQCVLTSADCKGLPLSEVEIDGDWLVQPYGRNTLSVRVPSGTRATIRSLCDTVVVVTLSSGVEVRFGLEMGQFPPDGIPVRAMPVSISSEEEREDA